MSFVSEPSFIISILALIAAAASALYAGFQVKTANQSLSLSVFTEAFSELGKQEFRDYRRFIRTHKQVFPDFTNDQELAEYEKLTDKVETVKIWIKDGDSATLEKDVAVGAFIQDKERVPFEATAVGADRIGFMLYKLEVPRNVKEEYLRWESSMYLLTWNRVAPYVARERKIRGGLTASPWAFTPFFEEIAYDSFKYCLKQDKNTKLVCLNPSGKSILEGVQ
jgi:hypothetical protein